MSLDDIAVSRRSFIQAGLATAGALLLPEDILAQENKPLAKADEVPVPKKPGTYDALRAQILKDPKGDDAGIYEPLKRKCIENFIIDVFKIAGDPRNPKRNPDPIVKEWFYCGNPKEQKIATERILQQTGDSKKADAIGYALPRTMTYVLHNGVGKKNGILLVDKAIFKLDTEQDILNHFDYEREFTQGCATNIKVNGAPLDLTNGVLSFYADICIDLDARLKQLTKINDGSRKVTLSYGATVKEKYLDAYVNCQNAVTQCENNATENHKKAAQTISQFLSDINSRMQKQGYEHKLIDAEKNTWDLVKVR